MFLADVDQLAEAAERNILCECSSRSVMLSPLRINGEVRGVMALCAPDPANLDKATEFIELARDAVSFSVERIQLSASVLKRNQELDTIKQIGDALAHRLLAGVGYPFAGVDLGEYGFSELAIEALLELTDEYMRDIVQVMPR